MKKWRENVRGGRRARWWSAYKLKLSDRPIGGRRSTAARAAATLTEAITLAKTMADKTCIHYRF